MLRVAGQEIDPRLVVFDKDGTLVAFGNMWHTWFDHLMEAIASLALLDAPAKLGLAETLGYDTETGEWDPLGPLTLASTKEVGLLVASQLYRYLGASWDKALQLVDQAESKARAQLPLEELLEPIGDVRAALQRLADHGLLLALATTDDRGPTEEALERLEISSLFATTVCGDDGIPLKPAPDMAREICARLGIAPREAIMVGDTPADAIMARRAGYSHAIGVTSGPIPRELLAPHADLVIPSIHAIEILPGVKKRSTSAGAEPGYDGYIFDLDGTIYLGERLIRGAQEVVSRLRSHGRRVVFLSNKPLEPRSSYAAKLTRLGIETPPEDVINSTRALIHYLREHCACARLHVIGERALADELEREGFKPARRVEEVDVVIAAFDRTLDYAKLNLAHQALVRGARFFATNADRTCPVEGGEIPDCAGVIAFLEATTGRKVEMVAGKPSRHMVDAALARLALPPQRCLVVGDRLHTDMRMGMCAGIDTALVLSGVTTRRMLAQSELRPTYVLQTVADLP